MEKYHNAMNMVSSGFSVDHESDMTSYLKELRGLKTSILGNMKITVTTIEMVEDDITTLRECLVKLAQESLSILCALKNVDFTDIMSTNSILFKKKNSDYGNSFVDFALIGIIVRLNDKINRILNLGESASEVMEIDEKIEDTINDLYNYCVIGLMYC